MSSFIGHSLAGLTAHAIGQKLQPNRQQRISWQARLWLLWLVTIALIPDLDYLIPALKLQHAGQTLRITHSFLGVLLLPIGTILSLRLTGSWGKSFALKSYQLVGVGLTHLCFDLLTGVFPEPLFYPFSEQTFRLPFGLLPSVGKIQLTNYLFYRNLLIEMGVLLPLALCLFISVSNSVKSSERRAIMAIGILVSSCFMLWAASLSR